MIYDDGSPIRNCFQTVDLVAMELVCHFPEQEAFTRAELLHTISDFFGQDGGQSDEIVIPEPGGTFVEYEDKWEEQEEEEDDG